MYKYTIILLIADETMRSFVTDVDHAYGDPNLQNPVFMMQTYMNWICMRGLKYDAARLIKRTWVYFVPGKNLDFSKIDAGDLVPKGDLCDWSNVLVDGQRFPEQLKTYYETNINGMNIYLIVHCNMIY